MLSSLLFEYTLEDRFIIALITLPLSILFLPQLRALTGIRFLERHFTMHLNAIARKLNRKDRATSTRIWRGVIVVFHLLVISAIFGWLVTNVSQQHNYGVLLYCFSFIALLPTQRLLSEGLYLRNLMRTKEETKAKEWLAKRSGFDTQHADVATLMRWQSHRMVRQCIWRIVTPCLFLVGLGFFPALAVSIIASAFSYWREHSNKEDLFYWALRHMHRLIQTIPARLALLPMFLAMLFTPKAKLFKALRCVIKHQKGGMSGCETIPLAFIAGAMHISLGGPERYQSGNQRSLPWLGDGSAQMHRDDFSRLVVLLILTVFIFWLMIASTLVALQFFGSL